MFYKETDPGPELATLIKCFWALEHDYSGPFHNYEHLDTEGNWFGLRGNKIDRIN